VHEDCLNISRKDTIVNAKHPRHTTHKLRPVRTSWDPLADWYDGWVGKEGSLHHRQLAIPAVLELLTPQSGEKILDIGAGQGVLVPHIAEKEASYVGVEASSRLLQLARKHHGHQGRFVQGDARRLQKLP